MTFKRGVFDLGNSILKGIGQSSEVQAHHALVEMSESAFNKVVKLANGCPDSDYVMVNDRFYAIGTQAEQAGRPTKMTGQAKYTPEYYGVMLAAMMGRLWKSSGDVVLYLSYPPGSIDYSDDMLDAAGERGKEWNVWCEGRSCTFTVLWSNAFEEPVGGAMNAMLTADGRAYQRSEMKSGNILAIDWGGGTIDFAGVFPNGRLNPAINDSIHVGINDVYKFMDENIRSQHKKRVRGVNGSLPPERLRHALRTGIYQSNGDDIPVHDIVTAGKNMIFNRFAQGYQDVAKGGANSDFIVMTGAGYVDLFDDVLPMLEFNPDKVFKTANNSKAHFDNANGGMKQLLMFESMGIVNYE